MILRGSAFTEHFLRLNGLDAAGFAAWEFLPGMRFGERAAWWRVGPDRDVPHEGLDLLQFRTPEGRRYSLGPGVRVPGLWAGVVAAVVPDFLGRSVFVAHDHCDGEGRRLYSAYGHLEPRPGLAPGLALGDGEEVGAIAKPRGERGAVPPHLHLTIALIRPEGDPGHLDWTALHETARAVLLDPLPLVCGA